MSKIEKSRPKQVIVFEPDTGVHFIWFVRVFGGNFQFNRNGWRNKKEKESYWTIKVHNIGITICAETSGWISTLYAFLNESIIKKGNQKWRKKNRHTHSNNNKIIINKWARAKSWEATLLGINDKNIDGGKCNCSNNKNSPKEMKTNDIKNVEISNQTVKLVSYLLLSFFFFTFRCNFRWWRRTRIHSEAFVWGDFLHHILLFLYAFVVVVWFVCILFLVSLLVPVAVWLLSIFSSLKPALFSAQSLSLSLGLFASFC